MSDYSQNTTFADKDALTPGDPDKVIKGSDIDAELSEIETAVNSKVDDVTSPSAGDYLRYSGSAWAAANANHFHVYRTASQTGIATATKTKITWGGGDVTVAISNSDLDQTNDRFTPSTAGTYVFSGACTLDDLADQAFFSVYLYKNTTDGSDGTELAFQNIRASGAMDPTLIVVSPPIAMNGSTDYAELWIQHAHGSNRNVLGAALGQTWFAGYRLWGT